jgi:hypothetical protein
VWNPERLEIEYKEEDQHSANTSQEQLDSNSHKQLTKLSPENTRRQNLADVNTLFS